MQQVSRIVPMLSVSAADDGDTRRGLSEIRQRPRQLPARPNVVAFGTNDWEQWGLWPSFESLGGFSLFDYKATGAGRSSGSIRKSLGAAFLRHVDEAEQAAPVDLVFFYAAGSWIDSDVLRVLHERKIWTVIMGLDDKQQLPADSGTELQQLQLLAAQSTDVYWTTWRYGVDWLSARGVRPWYAPEAADADFFAPRDIARDIDVLWLGRAYGPRFAFVRWLKKCGFNVKTFGPGWPEGMLPFEEMVDMIARSHVVLGMGGVGQTDKIKHLKGRDFEVPMCGAVYLTGFNPELTDHYDIGREILCYSSEIDCAEVLGYVLRRPQVAERIRQAARARCITDHTWKVRLERLFALLRMAAE